jgi:hypothetical protein
MPHHHHCQNWTVYADPGEDYSDLVCLAEDIVLEAHGHIVFDRYRGKTLSPACGLAHD